MSDYLNDLGYLSSGSQLRRIYEKLQVAGDKVYSQAGIDFKSSWFPIYHVLAKSKRSLTIMEITNQISFSHITVNNVIKELLKKGLVQIKSNPGDGRSKLISLSTKGFELLDVLEPVWLLFSDELKSIFEISDILLMELMKEVNVRLEEEPLDKRVLQKYFNYSVRNAKPNEFKEIGDIMVDVYSSLKGFPDKDEQPEYYKMLSNVGELTKTKGIEILVAISKQEKIGGAVVFFNDMKDYGSGGSATKELEACGFRLLAVDSKLRGQGLGKMLTNACIEKGRKGKYKKLVIHTTKAMKIAWTMYEDLGFQRAEDLDFMQGELPVFGFRLEVS
ncbi:bifunctional helix-turn-helix transcriptional regulator/GNAT family N-acetyltransferase [Maribacter algarum]|uniref:Bifunctional helix-turn-helix transcriptional regulator/GNAT family N-acetyltransferase n=1 Tax=Maribacter algarum (ex Zhang et al. 2020) TaxID=2578118 RepID=A0A5S3PI21_9FLAO|nr:bifunctional helix-turn-helix transcriptional regulator/GNAT family N-acetyltransferase [Maribacter algarum]TMM53909.1 bifunctional helix-turn-helix transcriptional regulator/GNAT family N-acetyltransferase [Maribacter algarum]